MERFKELKDLKDLIVYLTYNYKGKAKAELAVAISIERNYSEVLLRPFRTPPRSPIPVNNLINNEEENRPHSRKKSIKFADPPKFFN